MAQITEEQFRQQLKSGAFSRVYLIFGAESALVVRYAAQLESRVRPKANSEFNLHRISGDAGVDSIAEAVETLPMMDSGTCVVVNNYDPEAASASDTKKLAQLLADLPDYCVLIFRAASLTVPAKKTAKWKAFIQAVAAAGSVLELPARTDAELIRFMNAFAQRRGCTMNAAAARELIERCGHSWERLQNEMEKLCAWTQSGEIGRDAVEAVSAPVPETAAYRMANALIAGNYDAAYRQLDTLLFQREEPVMLLGALISAYVDLYRARAAADSGEPVASLAEPFRYGKMEFKLKNAARDCRRYSLPQLRRCLDILDEADRALKSSRTDSRIVLEKMMAQLMCAAMER